MADSNPINYGDMFSPDAWEKFIANLEKSKALLADVNGGLTGISKKTIGDVTGNNSGKKTSLDDYKKEEAAINKINATYEAKKKLMQEQLVIEKQLIDYKAKVAAATKEEAASAKALEKEKEKLNKLSREEIQVAKLTEKANNSKAGSYNKISAQLGLAQIKLKALSQAERENTKEGKILSAQVLSYQNQLIRLDEKVNVHSRSVGHYELALGKLGKGIKGVSGLLGELGMLLGFDTEIMERFVNIGKTVNKTLKEIHHVEGLENAVKKEGVEIKEAEIGAETLMNAELATSSTLRAENVVQQEASVAWTEAEIEAQIEAIIVQNELNAAMSANPIMLVVAGVLALVGVLAYFIESSDRAKLAEEEKNKATDGTIIKNKELRETYNKIIISLHENANAIKVAKKELSEFDAEIDNINFNNLQKFNESMNEIRATLIENEGTWNGLILSLTNVDVAFEKAKKSSKDAKTQMDAENLLETNNAIAKRKIASIKENEKNAQDLRVASIENDLAVEELTAQNSISTRRELLRAQAEIDKERIENDDERASKELVIDEKLATELLKIDKEYAEQRRSAHNDELALQISNMKDGSDISVTAIHEMYNKQLATISEEYRKQREAILYDTTKTETEKKDLYLLLENQFSKEALAADEIRVNAELKLIQEGNKKKLDNYLEYWDGVISGEKENSEYLLALNEAMNDIANAQLKEDLVNKKITKEQYDAEILKNQLELDKQLAAIREQADSDEVDREKIKLDLLLQAQKDGFATPEQVEAQQQKVNAALHKLDIDHLNDYAKEKNDEVDLAKLASDKKLKITQDELTQLSEINKAIGKGLDERNKAQQDALKIQSDQIDSELSTQASLFAQGLDNQLAYEQRAKAENTQKELAAARKAAKEKKGIELANTYISFLQSYLKDGTNAQSAATKALAQTLIAEGIADAIAGTALEGTEDTGGGNLGLDGKGGMLYMVHPNERILTKEQNRMIGNISNDDLAAMANLYSPNMQTRIPDDSVGGNGSVDLATLIQLNMKSNSEVVKAISGIRTTNISVDDQKRIVEVTVQNGLQKTIIHKDNIFRS